MCMMAAPQARGERLLQKPALMRGWLMRIRLWAAIKCSVNDKAESNQ